MAAQQPGVARLPLGYFGASTGAAAALLAAGRCRRRRGRGRLPRRPARPGRAAAAVRALPHPAHRRRRRRAGARAQPAGPLAADRPSRLVVVPGATHLFEEPGALEQVAGLARDWFLTHLTRPDPPAPTATEHAPFSWRAAAPAITGLPHGRGLNIAHEAVDRHLLRAGAATSRCAASAPTAA